MIMEILYFGSVISSLGLCFFFAGLNCRIGKGSSIPQEPFLSTEVIWRNLQLDNPYLADIDTSVQVPKDSHHSL